MTTSKRDDNAFENFLENDGYGKIVADTAAGRFARRAFIAGLRYTAEIAKKRIKILERHEMFPAYGLNSQVEALEKHLEAIEAEAQRLEANE